MEHTTWISCIVLLKHRLADFLRLTICLLYRLVLESLVITDDNRLKVRLLSAMQSQMCTHVWCHLQLIKTAVSQNHNHNNYAFKINILKHKKREAYIILLCNSNCTSTVYTILIQKPNSQYFLFPLYSLTLSDHAVLSFLNVSFFYETLVRSTPLPYRTMFMNT